MRALKFAAAAVLAVTTAGAAERTPLMLPPQTHEEVIDFFASLVAISIVASEICPSAVLNAPRIDEIAEAWHINRPGDVEHMAALAKIAKAEVYEAANKRGHAEWCYTNMKLDGIMAPFADWKRRGNRDQ